MPRRSAVFASSAAALALSVCAGAKPAQAQSSEAVPGSGETRTLEIRYREKNVAEVLARLTGMYSAFGDLA